MLQLLHSLAEVRDVGEAVATPEYKLEVPEARQLSHALAEVRDAVQLLATIEVEMEMLEALHLPHLGVK